MRSVVSKSAASDLAAVGRIEICGYNNPLPNTLLCNGGEYSRTTYSRLFSKIGTTWGAGDGNTTFNVPNLVAHVPWMAETQLAGGIGRGYLPNITGSFAPTGLNVIDNQPSGAFYHIDTNITDYKAETRQGYGVVFGFDASRSSPIYVNVDKVVPSYATCLYCIRY